jgi:hypothetical protein
MCDVHRSASRVGCTHSAALGWRGQAARGMLRDMAQWFTRERVIVLAFVVVTVAPVAVAVTRSAFWEPEHSMAPVAAAIYLAVVVALFGGRYRWAWVVLSVFNAAVFVGALIDVGGPESLLNRCCLP